MYDVPLWSPPYGGHVRTGVLAAGMAQRARPPRRSCALPLAPVVAGTVSWPALRRLASPLEQALFDSVSTDAGFVKILRPDARGPNGELPRGPMPGAPSRVDDEQAAYLMRQGVWSPPCARSDVRVLSPAFTVPKSDGLLSRLVWDGRIVNHFLCRPPSLPLPSPLEVAQRLASSEAIVTIDLKSWFYQLRIAPALRRLSGVRLGRRLLKFLVLPMGLSWAPAVAHTASQVLTRAVAAGAGARDSTVWIDDIAFAVQARAVPRLLRWWSKVCRRVGAVFKPPTVGTTVSYVGLEVDAARVRWRLSPKWCTKVGGSFEELLTAPTVTLGELWFAFGVDR